MHLAHLDHLYNCLTNHQRTIKCRRWPHGNLRLSFDPVDVQLDVPLDPQTKPYQKRQVLRLTFWQFTVYFISRSWTFLDQLSLVLDHNHNSIIQDIKTYKKALTSFWSSPSIMYVAAGSQPVGNGYFSTLMVFLISQLLLVTCSNRRQATFGFHILIPIALRYEGVVWNMQIFHHEIWRVAICKRLGF